MQHSRISDLNLHRRHWKIRVRVSATWKSSTISYSQFDCILIDEDGARIQASTRENECDLFASLLNDGHVYDISGFKVIPNRKKFRPVPHDFMIRLDKGTSVLEISPETVSIPLHKFAFTNFSQLNNLIHKDENLIDVIGQLLTLGSLDGRTEHERRSLEIRDTSGIQMLITLWGKHAIDFDETDVLDRTDPVIIIFVGMTVRTWEGRVCLCSSHATRYYINLDIPEVNEFSKRIPGTATVQVSVPAKRQPATTTTQTVTTIANLLNTSPSDSQNVKFMCKATLIDIDPSEGWWYRACPKCKTAIQTYKSNIWCNRCSEADLEPIPWYKLNVIVEDVTGTANFIIFGKLVQDLVDIPVANLATSSASDRFTLPPVFNKLLGKEYLFTVLTTNRSIQQTTKCFRVVTVNIQDQKTIIPSSQQTDLTTGSKKVADNEQPSSSAPALPDLFLEPCPPQIAVMEKANMNIRTNILPPTATTRGENQTEQPASKKLRNLTMKKEKRE